MTTQEIILNLQPYPLEKYESIDLNRLTVFVINLLNEMNIPTTIENITVANFRLFPQKFQMVDYSQFPDMVRANRALLQLRPKYRGWATGTVKYGFQLNSKGEEIAQQTKTLLDNLKSSPLDTPQQEQQRDVGKATMDRKAHLLQIRESECFKKYLDNHEIRGLDFLDMLNAYSHTPPDELRRSIRLLETIAKDFSDNEILDFFKWCRNQFDSYLRIVNKKRV